MPPCDISILASPWSCMTSASLRTASAVSLSASCCVPAAPSLAATLLSIPPKALNALDILASSRVDLQHVAVCNEEGHLDDETRFHLGWLVASGGSVAFIAGFSVFD